MYMYLNRKAHKTNGGKTQGKPYKNINNINDKQRLRNKEKKPPPHVSLLQYIENLNYHFKDNINHKKNKLTSASDGKRQLT